MGVTTMLRSLPSTCLFSCPWPVQMAGSMVHSSHSSPYRYSLWNVGHVVMCKLGEIKELLSVATAWSCWQHLCYLRFWTCLGPLHCLRSKVQWRDGWRHQWKSACSHPEPLTSPHKSNPQIACSQFGYHPTLQRKTVGSNFLFGSTKGASH